ncbi:MAG: 4'-phosphopantetheinyl transferase superfamily protein [Prevotella sp.]|nr:4'-phosphopantetheinyl transferase superfamily protein [Prevotella sp.]
MVYIDEHIEEFDLQAALGEISEQRREQALRFKHERGQRTCVLAYLLLKMALRREYGITENPLFEYGEHGKPLLAGHPEIHFNLSHCREAVACAVSRQPVGIDVESVREYKESLARYTMNEAELAEIAAAERPDVAFTRLWTMKEARLKWSGEGLSNNLKEALADAPRSDFKTTVDLSQRFVYTVYSPAMKQKGNT